MKESLKKILCLALLAVFIVSAVFFVIPKVENRVTDEKNDDVDSVVVLTVWHVESVEGGVGSRCDWLKKRAREFEKRNKGVYLDVVKLTETQLADKLSQGQSFDIVSFGLGIGEMVLPRLVAFDSINDDVYRSFLNGGMINGKLYALPYMCGGYVLAARIRDLTSLTRYISLKESAFDCFTTKKTAKKTLDIFSIMTAASKNCCPLVGLSLLANGEKRDLSKVYCEPSLTQYGAYEKFLAGNTATILLGTQRDFWRLSTRVANGKISEICFAPLIDYTDLVQYVGLGNSRDATRMSLSESFASYLTSEAPQKKLSAVGMLSVVDVDVYADGVMREMAEGIKTAKTVNVFTSSAVLDNLYADAKKTISDGQQNLLKKYLV